VQGASPWAVVLIPSDILGWTVYPTIYITLGVSVMPRDIGHRSAFESHGETYVRMLASKGGDIGAQAEAWLGEQQALRDEAAAAKRDAREEETLSIAREALASAKEANRIARDSEAAARLQARWAMWAAIIATVAAIVAISAA